VAAIWAAVSPVLRIDLSLILTAYPPTLLVWFLSVVRHMRFSLMSPVLCFPTSNASAEVLLCRSCSTMGNSTGIAFVMSTIWTCVSPNSRVDLALTIAALPPARRRWRKCRLARHADTIRFQPTFSREVLVYDTSICLDLISEASVQVN
jgi:hypothetical protein